MSDLLLSAVFTAFTMVRLLRGPWLRNPQYLASGIVGAVVAALLLQGFWPGADDDFVIGGLTGVFGSWAGMVLFDTLLSIA
ncbi:hypothetical protein [Mesorhizobium sp. INR15]|uniref:hypothetical protein n=1 Tax=Mesorhizobium sp. INR15 TaxID=2654248 RepID=UPI0021561FFF|nr:hypothetical protein [Mesorhizobium sp. INR15]